MRAIPRTLATGSNNSSKQVSVNAWNAGHNIHGLALADIQALTPAAGQLCFLTASGREGVFQFSSSNLAAYVTADTAKGIYIAPASDTTGASGAWVRQFSGPADVKWWGAVADDTGYLGTSSATDNATAFASALATLKARKLIVNSTDAFCEALWLDGHFYTSASINLKQGIRLLGASSKYVIRSRIRFPIDTDGIIVNTTTTTGSTTEAASTDATGVIVDGIHLLGGGGSTGHGFRLRARASIRNGGARNFGEDGVNARTYALGSGGVAGNANCFDLRDLWLLANGRHGCLMAGADSNAGYGLGLDCSYNGCFGIADYSFLGAFFYACHAEQNGNANRVTNAGVPSGTEAYNGTEMGKARAFNLGRAYACKVGEEAGASTTEPTSGMVTPWIDLGTTGGASTEVPQWTSGMQVRAGGPYAQGYMDSDGSFIIPNANNRGAFDRCYSEGGQSVSQGWAKGEMSGILEECGYKGTSNFRRTGLANRLTLTNGIETDDGSWVLNGTGGLQFVGTGSFAGTGDGQIYKSASGGLQFIGANGSSECLKWFNEDGTECGNVTTNTIDLNWLGNVAIAAGKALKVGSNQVVGARGAAVADATDAASAITQLNALLARMRAHGLIAT